MKVFVNILVVFGLMILNLTSAFSIDCINLQNLLKTAAKNHYESFKVDNNFIRRGFLGFLDSIDEDRIYFYREDVESWLAYIESMNSSSLMRDTCKLIEHVSEVYSDRNEIVKEKSLSILLQAKSLDDIFPISSEDTIEIDTGKVDFFLQEKIYEDRLKPILRYDVVSNMDQGSSFEEGVKNVISLFEKKFTRYSKKKKGDYYDFFLTSLLQKLDPHSDYESFFEDDVDLNSSEFVGFGMDINIERGNRYYIKSILKGASKELRDSVQEYDELVGVSDKNGKIVNIRGLDIREVDNLLIGKAGTSATLIFSRKVGYGSAARDNYFPLTLTRRVISMSNGNVYSSIYEQASQYTNKKYKVGVLRIKAFLVRASSEGTVSEKVLEELDILNKNNVDSLIIDLRGNGGGSVDETIKILNFFFDSPTPLAVIKNSDNEDPVDINDPKRKNVLINGVFDKPLVVLIDKKSASASEIFAGAIQDLGRGIVVGGQSYGKSTMQSLLTANISVNKILGVNNIRQYKREYTLDPKAAYIRLTTSRVYRLSGNCIQNVGVTPDILTPFTNTLIDVKTEREYEESYTTDRIAPQKYKKMNVGIHIPFLKQRSLERIKASGTVASIDRSVKDYKKDENTSTLKSLNPAPRKTFSRESVRKMISESIEQMNLDESIMISVDLIDSTNANVPPSL